MTPVKLKTHSGSAKRPGAPPEIVTIATLKIPAGSIGKDGKLHLSRAAVRNAIAKNAGKHPNRPKLNRKG